MMNELALYIHIPFCKQKCLYCDFLSGPSNLDKVDTYIEALSKEMHSHKELIAKYQVRSIFLGGGTPSILNTAQITKVMESIYSITKKVLLPTAEITIETNPGTLTKEKMETYQRLGINRISMGLQSTHNDELKALGRIHTYEEFLEGYQLARQAGFTNINIDLMSGLPHQTPERFETTLNRIIALSPEHISAYSLIIEEGTRFYELYGSEKGSKLLPNEEQDRYMYHKTKELLANAGYHRYEISNYAKPGKESIHNKSYWTGIDYLGLGLGSSSLIKNRRYRNEEKMTYYLTKLQTGQPIMNLEETLSIQDQIEEFMILGLRLTQGIRLCEFQTRFGKPIIDYYKQEIEYLTRLGMLTNQNGYLALTESAVDVSNEILTYFLH
ncbi:MAG: oxygen-independent coproporphyrinogen III oxidase [Clostridium sp.]|nr:oxygen-independent coproporphyrinogen III oxidase [Clostridium sp.]